MAERRGPGPTSEPTTSISGTERPLVPPEQSMRKDNGNAGGLSGGRVRERHEGLVYTPSDECVLTLCTNVRGLKERSTLQTSASGWVWGRGAGRMLVFPPLSPIVFLLDALVTCTGMQV